MTTEAEWRRGWKPDLKTCPWKPLKTQYETFHVKTVFRQDCYDLMITDFVSAWQESLTTEDVTKRTKTLNPSVEAPTDKIIDLLRENVEDNKKEAQFSSSFKKQGESERILLTMNTKLAGLPFVWKFYGQELDKQEFSDHVTLPLLTMVGELTRRQEELFNILRRKDKEIEDLKAQGVKSSRKHLQTGVFLDTVFTNDMAASNNFTEQIRQQGRNSFTVNAQDLYRSIMMRQAYLNRDRSAREDGESMEDVESLEGATAAGTSGGHSWNNRLPPSLLNQGASVSPKKSPAKSPGKNVSSPEPSPVKDTELLRRQALLRKLEEEEEKKEQKAKKKKVPTATLR